MSAKKKTSKRKTSKGKITTRKTTKKAAKKGSTINIEGTIPKLTLNMPLDARKTKAIQRCIEKGELKISINKVDLAGGKIGDPWLYD